MSKSVYTISIEPVDGETFKYGFHLGTNERVARFEVEGMFQRRTWFTGKGEVRVRTIGLWHDDKLIDVYDGQWDIISSDNRRLRALYSVRDALERCACIMQRPYAIARVRAFYFRIIYDLVLTNTATTHIL